MKILVYEGSKKLVVREIDDLAIGKDEIRIETMYSGISHGTEMNVYRGIAPFFTRTKDSNTNLFRDASKTEKWKYPIRSCDEGVWYMGYANVGRVIEVGKEIKKIRIGDVVYSNSSHQSQVIKKEDDVIKLPEHIKPETGIFFTNLMTAYNGILDTEIKLGDTVVVSGLGILGQLVSQMAKKAGAFSVYGIDLINKRIRTAIKNGIDGGYNPTEFNDIANEIRKKTNYRGADCVIEVTGNQKALNEAVRIAAPDTSVTALGWYQGQCINLNLSEEFHHNRINIISSQTGDINPHIRHMWDNKRKEDTCIKLLGQLELENLITHKVPFDEAADAYKMIDNSDKDVIQIVLTY